MAIIPAVLTVLEWGGSLRGAVLNVRNECLITG